MAVERNTAEGRAPSTLSQREGGTLSCAPSADAVAGNGGTLSCAPSADTVAAEGTEEHAKGVILL
jgi:hypothetical protein